MDDDLRNLVRQRAGHRCEYCRLEQRFLDLSFHIDHVISRQHSGATVESNLALACSFCNQRKGPNIAGLDRQTNELSRLFHPRSDVWTDHFRWSGAIARGVTAVGRVTIAVLAINQEAQVAIRSTLIREGQFSS